MPIFFQVWCLYTSATARHRPGRMRPPRSELHVRPVHQPNVRLVSQSVIAASLTHHSKYLFLSEIIVLGWFVKPLKATMHERTIIARPWWRMADKQDDRAHVSKSVTGGISHGMLHTSSVLWRCFSAPTKRAFFWLKNFCVSLGDINQKYSAANSQH